MPNRVCSCCVIRVERGVARMPARHDQMAGQRRLGRAHPPDVQIVQRRHPGQGREMRAHRLEVEPFGHRVEGEADRTPEQPPAADHDDRRDDEAYCRIEPQPMGQADGDPGDDDPGGDQRVGGHMDKGAPDIEIAGPARGEQQSRPAIDRDAGRRDPDHDSARNRDRMGRTRHSASQAMPPVTTKRITALASAARIEVERSP